MTSIFSLLAKLQKHRHKAVKSPINNTSLWLKCSHESKLLLQICLIVSTDSFETKDKASVIEEAVTDPGFWFSRLSCISSECLHWRWTKTHIRNIRMANWSSQDSWALNLQKSGFSVPPPVACFPACQLEAPLGASSTKGSCSRQD